MALLRRRYYIVAHFTENATNAELNQARTQAINQLKSLGFTDADIRTRGPIEGYLFDPGTGEYVITRIGVVEVVP